MNLHDLDQPRMAPAEFLTPEMLQRVRDHYGTYLAQVHVPEGATIDRIALYAHPRWTIENPTFQVGEWDEEIANIRREAIDEVHEVRQDRDGYWRYEMRVTNLDLPRRIDGVFLDAET